MGIRSIAQYEIRVTFGWSSAVATLLLPSYALLGWIIWTTQQRTPSLFEITTAFELLLPLAAGLLGSQLMSIERDERFDEIRRSYPEAWWHVPLLRSCIAIVFIVLAAVVGAVIFRFAYGDYHVTEIVLPAIPPALYLLSLALLINNMSSNYWIAMTAVIGYWFIDYQTAGHYTGALFLFRTTIPQPDVHYEVNRWLLIGIALLLFVLNGLFSKWRRRGRG